MEAVMQAFFICLFISIFCTFDVSAQEASLDNYDGSDDFPLILVVHNVTPPALVEGRILWKEVGCQQYDDMTEPDTPVVWLPMMTEVTTGDLLAVPYSEEPDRNEKFLIGTYWLRSDGEAIQHLCDVSS